MIDASADAVGGRYRLVEVVGRGGMGVVWRAHDSVLNRTVALKQVVLDHLPPGPSRTDALARVLNEARTAARLRHPSVVTIYDVIEENGTPWIVMEFLVGRSLEEELAEVRHVSEARAAEIGLAVLGALNAAHRAGITHRDVKPANILLLANGLVVLTDFGIAQAEGDPTLTATGTLIGSPAFMAPERLNGERAVAASDLWSLGVVLYAAVEGRPPFRRGDTMAALFAAILTRDPEPMRTADRLRPLIAGLLTKDPRKRMTAPGAAEHLTRAASRPGRQRRRPVRSVAAALAMAVVVIVVVVALPLLNQERISTVSIVLCVKRTTDCRGAITAERQTALLTELQALPQVKWVSYQDNRDAPSFTVKLQARADAQTVMDFARTLTGVASVTPVMP
ncbi:serine/threonine protein kinase [Planotetraspora sp. A-T 1434]|uniref:serine/threonine-protein kinase n=1 Tax=Planotetraspora sp. A-T 1434 TaxID=2979219 RepID=UPI0021C04868|nr:serine/threonine-protein kinase [Planotetraspora sp. A-T 1434]MCT9933692.1 serine/threonine protein kinase [Planotetraspora sp. A-T 1434]